jgi:hypothetical protein
VSIARGKIKVEATGSFFSVKIPTAIACMSIRENIIELCTVGQNFPAVSYFGAYTFMNCMVNLWSISTSYFELSPNVLINYYGAPSK